MGEISPQLFRFYSTGTFAFHVQKKKKYTQLIAHSNEASSDTPKVMNYGFEFKRKGLDHEIPKPGQYVHLLVDGSVTRSLLNNKNYLFISQYNPTTKKWVSEKYYFSSPYKRSYRVSLKVAEGVSRLIMGCRFTATSPKDQIRIRKMDLYITNKPLIEAETPHPKERR